MTVTEKLLLDRKKFEEMFKSVDSATSVSLVYHTACWSIEIKSLLSLLISKTQKIAELKKENSDLKEENDAIHDDLADCMIENLSISSTS